MQHKVRLLTVKCLINYPCVRCTWNSRVVSSMTMFKMCVEQRPIFLDILAQIWDHTPLGPSDFSASTVFRIKQSQIPYRYLKNTHKFLCIIVININESFFPSSKTLKLPFVRPIVQADHWNICHDDSQKAWRTGTGFIPFPPSLASSRTSRVFHVCVGRQSCRSW